METPPIVNEFTNDSFHIMNELLKSGELKKIQDDYLYWNKVKYRTTFTNKTDVWSAVKLHRKINSTLIKFGQYEFYIFSI